MKSILPCLTALIWAAAPMWSIAQVAVVTNAGTTSPAGESSPTTVSAASTPTSQSVIAPRITAGDQLLLQAIARLERHESLAARLQYKASINGRSLSGAGSYWQQGSGEALRVRFELRVTGETSLLQVSNGRFLWIDRRLPTRRTVNRIDLRRIRADAARQAAKLDELQPGQANWSPIRPELAAYFGGLPKLLSALSESFTFEPPQAMRLSVVPAGASQPTSLPVFAMVGHWKQERLAAMLPKFAPAAADTDDSARQIAALPPRVPQEVLLLIGQSDLFPYRVEYRKLLQRSAAPGRQPAPYQLSAEPLVLLELSDVSFNLPIGAGQFDYSPGNTKWNDRTTEYLDKIRHQHEEQLAARKREPKL